MRHEQTINRMIERWNASNVPLYERLYEALAIIEEMHEERLKLQRRIHNQRRAWKENWEIVEQRGNSIGSPKARERYILLWNKYRELRNKANGQVGTGGKND